MYANEPLTWLPEAAKWDLGEIKTLSEGLSSTLTHYRPGSLDPFDSYPPTRLARAHTQRLIHTCT